MSRRPASVALQVSLALSLLLSSSCLGEEETPGSDLPTEEHGAESTKISAVYDFLSSITVSSSEGRAWTEVSPTWESIWTAIAARTGKALAVTFFTGNGNFRLNWEGTTTFTNSQYGLIPKSITFLTEKGPTLSIDSAKFLKAALALSSKKVLRRMAVLNAVGLNDDSELGSLSEEAYPRLAYLVYFAVSPAFLESVKAQITRDVVRDDAHLASVGTTFYRLVQAYGSYRNWAVANGLASAQRPFAVTLAVVTASFAALTALDLPAVVAELIWEMMGCGR